MQNLLLHLSLIPGLGSLRVASYIFELQQRSEPIPDFYTLSISDLARCCSLRLAQADRIVKGLRDCDLLSREQELLTRHGIDYITILDAEYPDMLRHIAHPPVLLYIRGSWRAAEKRLAVVGARKGDEYAQQAIDALLPEIVQAGWTIVSGGAIGVDTMAHKSAIQQGGRTIVVLGSGLLQPYPSENRVLFDQIADQHGAVLSPFPLMMAPSRHTFPARNRIIAGMSRGCLVVQAAQRSGASITAHLAMEQGREVFAVPGAIDHTLSAGCHRLIQEGARLITGPQDILSEFGEKLLDSESQLSLVAAGKPEPARDPIDQRILDRCRTGASFDELADHIDLSDDLLRQKLFELSLEDQLEQDFMGTWRRR